jgi:AcrR family transcriptional regulator
MTVVRRGRPRNESCTETILTATLDLVSEVGIAALTVDAVAERAGVGKATIYRRWSSKEALMLDAWTSCIVSPPVPDTGTVRGDLLELFRSFDDADHPLEAEARQRVYPQMIAAAKVNREVADAYRAFVAERRRPLRSILDRAVERGELPDTADLDLVHDLLVAPLAYRWLVHDEPTSPEVVERNIDLVLAGARATSPVRS